MGSRKKASDIPLIPMPEFEKTVRGVLSNTKKDIDREIARMKASNKRRRRARKPDG